MRYFMVLSLAVLVSGCMATTDIGPEPVNSLGINKIMQPKKLLDTDQVAVGSEKSAVQKMLGQQVVVGYEDMQHPDKMEPVAVENPYRVQTLSNVTMNYDVEYYFTHIQQPDDIISDNELTPMVYENGILVAKGWQSLQKLIDQHGLK